MKKTLICSFLVFSCIMPRGNPGSSEGCHCHESMDVSDMTTTIRSQRRANRHPLLAVVCGLLLTLRLEARTFVNPSRTPSCQPQTWVDVPRNPHRSAQHRHATTTPQSIHLRLRGGGGEEEENQGSEDPAEDGSSLEDEESGGSSESFAQDHQDCHDHTVTYDEQIGGDGNSTEISISSSTAAAATTVATDSHDGTDDDGIVVEPLSNLETKEHLTKSEDDGASDKGDDLPYSAADKEATVVEEDCSANIDRMELADAYDEGETTPGHFDVERLAPKSSTLQLDSSTIQTLVKELHYKRQEAKNMRPEVALVVAQKKLFRPVEGVPAHWFMDGRVPRPTSRVIKILQYVVLPMLVGATSIGVASRSDEIFSSLRRSNNNVMKLPVEPPKVQEFWIHENETKALEDVVSTNEHTTPLGQPHPHSIKPGVEDPVDDPDITWLDRGLTRVGRGLRSLWSKEI